MSVGVFDDVQIWTGKTESLEERKEKGKGTKGTRKKNGRKGNIR